MISFSRRLWGKFRWYTSRAGIKQVIEIIKHLGLAVECPICGWRGRKFYMVSYPQYRDNAFCPRCHSLERHRMLYLLLQKILAPNIRSVLEIAPGSYSYKIFENYPNIKYFTVDLESKLAKIRSDITNIPFNDNAFDIVICFHVLEHIPNDQLALSEICRILNTAGKLLVQVPIDRQYTYEDAEITRPEDRLQHFGQHDHVRAYGEDFVDILMMAKLAAKPIYPKDILPTNLIARYGLSSSERIFLCEPI